MRERSILYFALGVLVVTCIGALGLSPYGVVFPDGSVQSSAAGRKLYYLTGNLGRGDAARFLCDEEAGFHLAHFFELQGLGNMRYARDEDLSPGHTARRKADSGSGPPAFDYGWVRNGYSASTSDRPGFGNCNAWTSREEGAYGMVAGTCSDPGFCPGANGAVWGVYPGVCHLFVPAWCVTD